jgi:hypothetical protein
MKKNSVVIGDLHSAYRDLAALKDAFPRVSDFVGKFTFFIDDLVRFLGLL